VAAYDGSGPLTFDSTTIKELLGVLESLEGFGPANYPPGQLYPDPAPAKNPTIGYGLNIRDKGSLEAVLNIIVNGAGLNVYAQAAANASANHTTAPSPDAITAYFAWIVSQFNPASPGKINDFATLFQDLNNALAQIYSGNNPVLVASQYTLPTAPSGAPGHAAYPTFVLTKDQAAQVAGIEQDSPRERVGDGCVRHEVANALHQDRRLVDQEAAHRPECRRIQHGAFPGQGLVGLFGFVAAQIALFRLSDETALERQAVVHPLSGLGVEGQRGRFGSPREPQGGEATVEGHAGDVLDIKGIQIESCPWPQRVAVEGMKLGELPFLGFDDKDRAAGKVNVP
jgi:hypothetical protein